MSDDPDEEGSGLADLCMTVIGVGYLFPISAIWAAFDYWKVLFPARNIEFNVTMVYQAFSLVTVMMLSFTRSVSLGPRIIGGFCGQFLCLFGILGFRWVTGLLPEADLYLLVLVLVSLCAVATGYLDSALLSLCSQYSPRMQGYLQLGIGFGTFLSVMYRDVTKLLFTGDMANSVTAYFAVALATVLVCISCYKLLMKLPVSRYVAMNDGKQALLATPPRSPVTPSSLMASPMIHRPPAKVNPLAASPKPAGFASPPSRNGSSRTENTVVLPEPDKDEASFGKVLAIVWKNQLTIFLNFVLTTLCYPGLLTSIPCRNFLGLRQDAWFQTLALTVFTLVDTAVRFVTHRRLCLTYKNIYMTVILRALLFPVLLYCAKSPAATDTLSLFTIGLFGAGNGYCVSLSLIVVNEIPDLTIEQRKTCGRISACAVNGGLAVGSFLAAGLAAATGLSVVSTD